MRLQPLGGDKFLLKAGYSEALRAASKLVPGVTWDSANKGYLGWGDALAEVLRIVEGKTREKLENPEALAPLKSGVGVWLPDKKLRVYQIDGVNFLLCRRSAILADDMGLGKTAQALTARTCLAQRTVIVCFKYVRDTMVSEIEKWCPLAETFRAEGTKPEDIIPQDANITLVHYDVLHAWLPHILAWGPKILILDEAQAIAGETARRAKAVRALSQVCNWRFFLTGTPMPNRVRDLWNILDTLNPGRWGTFFQFAIRYCDGHKVEIPEIGKTVYNFDGRSNEEELQRRLSWVMLRRSKSDVAAELPPLTRQIVWVEGKEKPAWRASLSRKTIRALLSRVSDDKLETALELVASHAARGRVVAGCYRRAVAEWLAEQLRARGVETELIHGGVSTERRTKYIQRAKSQARGALVATIDCCATGVDFSWANVGVVVEPTYEPHEMLQFESRLHRHGAVGDMTLIQYVIARGGVDELVLGRVIEKLESYSRVLTSQEGASKMSSDLGGAPSGEDILKEIGL